MNRLGLINALVGMVFGLLVWATSPAQAACDPNIRATTPTGDFLLDDGNGTATHLKTGLIWMRCALGQSWDSASKTCTGSPSTYPWGAALRAAHGYSFAGHSDWRPPNVKELASIVEERCSSPSINETVFPGVSSSSQLSWYYWSSSPLYQWNPSAAWAVYFTNGEVYAYAKGYDFLVRLVRGGQSFGDYVSGGGGDGGVTVTPQQPVYGNPPTPVTVLTGYRKYLVLLIHGWRSNPGAWAIPMKTNIVNRLKAMGYSSDGDACEKPLEKDGVSWQICWYDWENQASLARSPLPPDAYVHAETEGKALAKRIASEPRSYDFIHFIAHSVGSQVADTAAKELPKRNTRPIIHTTFLDAYNPFGSFSSYGFNSNWAEQYVDIRRVVDYILNNTDITLEYAYNFDITELDPNGNNPDPHSWPYQWYEQTTANPDSSYYGFGLSLESGRDRFSSAADFVVAKERRISFS